MSRSSTERWYCTVSVDGVLRPQAACKSVMHFPCRLQLNDLGFLPLKGGGGGEPDRALRLQARVEALVPRRCGGGGGGHSCVHKGNFQLVQSWGGRTKIFFKRRGLRCAPTSPTTVLGTGRDSTWTLHTLPATAMIGAQPMSLAATVAGATIVRTNPPPPPPQEGFPQGRHVGEGVREGVG